MINPEVLGWPHFHTGFNVRMRSNCLKLFLKNLDEILMIIFFHFYIAWFAIFPFLHWVIRNGGPGDIRDIIYALYLTTFSSLYSSCVTSRVILLFTKQLFTPIIDLLFARWRSDLVYKRKPRNRDNSKLCDEVQTTFEQEVTKLLGPAEPESLTTDDLSSKIRTIPVNVAKIVLPSKAKAGRRITRSIRSISQDRNALLEREAVEL